MLGFLYDYVDSWGFGSGPVTHLAYWVTTWLLYLGALAALKASVLALVGRIPRCVDRISLRHDVAEAMAKSLAPEKATSRSFVAGCPTPPAEVSPDLHQRWFATRGKLEQIPESTLRRWVRWEYQCDCIGDFVRTVGRALGGARGLVLSLILTLHLRPYGELTARVREGATALWDFIEQGDAARSLPVLVVVVGFLAVVGRASPIIDRVRAPGEAAKDANKLLASLTGNLVRLGYSLSGWSTFLESNRSRILDYHVRASGNDRYGWRSYGAVAETGRFRDLHRTHPISEWRADTLQQSIEALRDCRNQIAVEGLPNICRRALHSQISSTWRLALFSWQLSEPEQDGFRYRTPSWILEALASRMSFCRITDSPESDEVSTDPIAHHDNLPALEDAAFDAGMLLDSSICEVLLAERHCMRIAKRLNRRVSGSLFTKSMNALGK